jgi:drug/metabolite transporter (DMT)-like permease
MIQSAPLPTGSHRRRRVLRPAEPGPGHYRAGTAAVLQALLPVATGLINVVWLGERLTRGLFVGLGLATIGVLLVAGQAAPEASPGAALSAAGVIAYAVYTVLLRGQPDRDPIVLATATCTWGSSS